MERKSLNSELVRNSYLSNIKKLTDALPVLETLDLPESDKARSRAIYASLIKNWQEKLEELNYQ